MAVLIAVAIYLLLPHLSDVWRLYFLLPRISDINSSKLKILGKVSFKSVNYLYFMINMLKSNKATLEKQ